MTAWTLWGTEFHWFKAILFIKVVSSFPNSSGEHPLSVPILLLLPEVVWSENNNLSMWIIALETKRNPLWSNSDSRSSWWLELSYYPSNSQCDYHPVV